MYGKVQKSGLIEITPLICTLIIRASILFFSILNPLKSAESKAAALADNNILCLRMWQVQFSSVSQSRPTLCDPMDGSTPGFPVHHQLPELAQTHVHRVCDAIQPSYPLMWQVMSIKSRITRILKIHWRDLIVDLNGRL